MFLPINQYYTYASPQKQIKFHKKDHKTSTNAESSIELEIEQQLPIATTDTPFDELTSSSAASSSSSENRNIENSNNNNI